MGRYSQADFIQTFHFTKGGETEVSGKSPGPLLTDRWTFWSLATQAELLWHSHKLCFVSNEAGEQNPG